MNRWEGKVALVTGASAGIGAAIVEELAKNGMKVVGLARRVDRVEDIKKKLGKVKGELFPLKGDVSKEEDILAAFKWIKEKFGTIHVLVNNAGIIRMGQFFSGESKTWRDTLDVNVLGLSICSQQAFKLMKETGVDDGHLVHINSIAGHEVPVRDNPTLNMYPSSKFAVTALADTMRQELKALKSKIKITSISPGAVKTEIVDASFLATTGSVPDTTDIWKIPALQGKDVADAVVFALATPPHVQIKELIIKPVGE